MPETAELTVCRLVADDWQLYRAVRLAMLKDSPWAFESTYADASALDELVWRERLTDNATFLARVGDLAVGSATYLDTQAKHDDEAELVGMWVDLGFRGSDVASALVSAALGEGRRRDKRRIVLWVVDHNIRARRFYERMGFVPTGEAMPYPQDESVVEIQLEHVL